VFDKCVVIKGRGIISALGHLPEVVTKSYETGATNFRPLNGLPVGAVPPDAEKALTRLLEERRIYRDLDRSVLMAIYAARGAVYAAGWAGDESISINIGSSRGATGLVETYVQQFQNTGVVPASTSPVTTLGNLSSWVGQDLRSKGAVISHSVTCSTGIQAIANACAWLKSGMAKRFLAGASEAPLTPFTLAQMRAMGIYSDDIESDYPCKPHNDLGKNTFVLSEGAAVFALELASLQELNTNDVVVEAVGFGFEEIQSKTGISREGKHFEMAMRDALQFVNADSIDLIVMHSPGTLAGDLAELAAIRTVFGDAIPVLSSTKWMTGHTFGASGCISLDYALYLLETQHYTAFPYSNTLPAYQCKSINRMMITAAGFGGNAAALIVSKRPELI
jgi:3-oxoacyl-[acyl-carrier-protein] synthase II